MDTLFRECHIHHLLCSLERIRPGVVGRKLTSMHSNSTAGLVLTRTLEPDDGEFSAF
jgi:hypothetical protein